MAGESTEPISNTERDAVTGIQIIAKTMTGWTIGYNMASSDTVSALKSMMEECMTIEREKQCLIYGHVRLENARTLGSYTKGDHMMIYVHTIVRITLMMPNAKRVCLYVPTVDTVEVIKDWLCIMEGIPPTQQRLMFAGQELEDWRTLGDYGIGEGCTLFLCPVLQSQ